MSVGCPPASNSRRASAFISSVAGGRVERRILGKGGLKTDFQF